MKMKVDVQLGHARGARMNAQGMFKFTCIAPNHGLALHLN